MSFATFGNLQTKQLIKAWQPKPLEVPDGSCLTPAATENMKRFVRARILLEDANMGCVASFDDSLCVILCRFSRAEHQLLLPLWQSNQVPTETFQDLIKWHAENFENGARISGNTLEWPEDRTAWMKITSE